MASGFMSNFTGNPVCPSFALQNCVKFIGRVSDGSRRISACSHLSGEKTLSADLITVSPAPAVVAFHLRTRPSFRKTMVSDIAVFEFPNSKVRVLDKPMHVASIVRGTSCTCLYWALVGWFSGMFSQTHVNQQLRLELQYCWLRMLTHRS